MKLKYYDRLMQHLIKLTTTIFSPILTIMLFFTHGTMAKANENYVNEIYVDKQCNYNPNLEQLERFTVFYKGEFMSNEEIYWLYAGRYQDGAVLLCVSQPDYLQPQPLNLPELQFNFIDSVNKQTDSDRTFVIEVRSGNGLNTTTNFYQIDLTNIDQPDVQLISN